MPSVVMVNAVCSGSHGRIMSDIGRVAQAAGFRTHIAFARGAANGADIRIGSMRDVYLHVAATRLLDRHGRASRRATERLTRQLADLRPDVLHLHNAHGYYLHYETFFAFLRQSGIPTVWTLHDCWAVTGHCSHFVRANCMRWRDGCHRCPLRPRVSAVLAVGRIARKLAAQARRLLRAAQPYARAALALAGRRCRRFFPAGRAAARHPQRRGLVAVFPARRRRADAQRARDRAGGAAASGGCGAV